MNWFVRYLEVPAAVDREFQHYFRLLNLVCPFALVTHMVFLPLFYAIGADLIAAYNIFSVSVFAFVIYINRRGHHFAAAALATIEIIGHAALAVHTFGWEFGFQYFMIPIITGSFTYPRRNVFGLVLSYLLVVGAFLGLYYYSRQYTPVWSGSPVFIHFFNAVNTSLSFFGAGLAVYYYREIAARSEASLEVEHQRSEELLHNILPVEIAGKLKEGKGTIADGFDEASVLFADLVGFTGLSQRISPEKLVALLNEVFSDFDDLAVRHGLEKIKTIGDAYMVASGIPAGRPDHAEAILDFAQDMIKSLATFNERTGNDLKLRIGINSGPVVAGVIGKKKFIYDLWGDSVNTAARMESHGLRDRIQVTEATYALTREKYDFEERGEIQVKGKGSMRVYLLKGPARDNQSPRPD